MKKTSIAAFDYLRAICCVMVLIGHTDALRIFDLDSHFFRNSLNFYYQNIGLLAVPIFFQVSLYLFYDKREQDPHYFYQKKFYRLLALFAFWLSCALVGKAFLNELNTARLLSDPIYFLRTIITGGDTLFYFLFSLIFISLLADLKMRWKDRSKFSEPTWEKIEFLGLFLTCGIAIAQSLLALKTQTYLWVAYNNPINFLPYIFSAYLIWKYTHKNIRLPRTLEKSAIAIMLGAIVFFIIIEWEFFNLADNPQAFFGDLVPQYARVSSILSSSLITYLFIRINPKPSSLVALISFCSLGIYCLHKFLPNFIGLALGSVTLQFGYNLATNIPLMSFLRFWSLLLGSLALTLALKRVKFLKNMV